MKTILSLDELENSTNKTLYFTFDEKIEGIDCVEPIKADLCAKDLGDFVVEIHLKRGYVLLYAPLPFK